MSVNLLELRNVSKVFRIGGLVFGTRLVAVDDVSLSLPAAEPSILSIVGESGSGKNHAGAHHPGIGASHIRRCAD